MRVANIIGSSRATTAGVVSAMHGCDGGARSTIGRRACYSPSTAMPETVRTEILVPPDTSELSELRASVYQFCEDHDISAQTTSRMVLAIDEALANVIEHGSIPRECPIAIAMETDGACITTQLRDRGVPFDPTPVVDTPNNQRFPRRGFGLYLMHLIVDSMEYTRTEDGENILTLTKKID